MITASAILFVVCVVVGVILSGLHPTLLEHTTSRRADAVLAVGMVLMFGSFMMFLVVTAVTHA
jgi:uncharacterized membrane protein (DUF485 family)